MDLETASLAAADHRPVRGGKALSSHEAAYCVMDANRTAAFLGGLVAAFDALRRRFPGERLRVLYAGCGPFATLAVPLMAGLRPGQAGFTLIDNHPTSLAAARRLVQALGLGSFVDAWLEGDAARVLPPGTPPAHLLLIECMQAGLENEPQLTLTRALAPLLVEGGLLVPGRITVSLATVGSETELGEVFALGLGSLEPPPTGSLVVGEGIGPDGAEVELRTRVDVFGPWGLGHRQADITSPRPARGLGQVRSGETVEFRYREGPDPGFEFRHRVGGGAPVPGVSAWPGSPQAPDPAPPRRLDLLARLWARSRDQAPGEPWGADGEWARDRVLLEGLGVGIGPSLEYLARVRPDLAQFEAWVLAEVAKRGPGR